jgi:uncharacterized RDD family membrane protein YckC
MIVTADSSGPVSRRPARRELVVEFSAENVSAPFLLRCGAVFMDYIVVVAAPVVGLVLNRLIDSSYGSPAGGLSNNTAWLIAILLGISNLIIIPALSGQTLGMMLVGIRIVTRHGREPELSRILIRNTIGYLLTLLSLGTGFLLAAIVPTGRALHDYISGTVVILAKKREL